MISTERATKLMSEAIMLQSQQKYSEALQLYDEISKAYPTHPDVLHNSAISKFHLGELDAAEQLFLKAIELRPAFKKARSNLVNLWVRMERAQTLSAIVDEESWFLSLELEVAVLLARYFVSKEDVDNALRVSKLAIALDPNACVAQHAHGVSLWRGNDPEAAEPYLRSALDGLSDNPEVMIDLSRCLTAMHMRWKKEEHWREARALAERAANIALDSPRIQHELGLIYEEDGAFGRAKDQFIAAAKAAPDYLPAISSLASVSRSDAPDDLLEDLSRLLSGETCFPPSEISRGYQALGKCLDHRGEYKRAFECFVQANEKVLQSKSYDRCAREEYTKNLIETYSNAVMMKDWPREEKIDRPVFIIGMPRSGTTLLEHMLSAHPDIKGAGELPFFTGLEQRGAALNDRKGFPVGDLAHRVQSELRAKLILECNTILDEIDPTKAHIIDKMPFNFTQVGMIKWLYPGARILCARREKLDVSLSCYIESFSDEHNWSYRLSDIAHFYNQFDVLMSHWKGLFPDTIEDVHYECLTQDPEGTVSNILDFIGLDWDDACLDYLGQSRSIRTPSTWQVRQPIYKSSVKRWMNYEAELQPLIKAFAEFG